MRTLVLDRKDITKLCNEASKKVGVLNRFLSLICCSALKLTMYKPCLLQYLAYCYVIWLSCKPLKQVGLSNFYLTSRPSLWHMGLGNT